MNGYFKLLTPFLLLSFAALLQIADGRITWIQPAPQYNQTSPDARRTAAVQQVLKGSINVSLDWEYALTGESRFSTDFYFTKSGGAKERVGEIRDRSFIRNSDNFRQRFDLTHNEAVTQVSMIIFNVTVEEEGLYTCDVVTDDNSWLDEIEVEVVEETKLTNVSESLVECEGSTVTLFCEATGRPLPNITWTRVLDDGSDGEIIQQETSPVLVLDNIQRNQSGTYRCTAYNGVGRSFNQTMNVTVNFSPSIDPLANQTVLEGQNVSLSCSVSAVPSASVQWISPSGDVLEASSITLVHILRNQSGEYICEASNRCGNVSESVFISVQYPPSIVTTFVNQTVNDSDTVTLDCTADSNPPANITWTRLFDNSSVSFPLTITGKQDEGFYRCTASNGVGSPATKDLFIAVENFRPFGTQVMTTLQNNVTEVNETFNVTCSAEANPPAEYMIYKDDISLTNITSHPAVLETSVTERVNEARYKCVPLNSFGPGPVKEITIAVHYEPYNVQLMTNISEDTTCTGQVVHLTCTAEANPPADVMLYRNDTMVAASAPGMWYVSMTSQGVAHYRCQANNSVGTGASNNVTLTFNVPSAIEPLEVSHTFTEGDSRTLYCNASGVPSPIVSWSKIDGSPVGIRNMLNFTSVNKNDAGMYKCEATNECGNASATTSIIVYYKPEDIQVTTNLTDLKTCLGTVVAINCTAQANPAATVVLYHNDMLLREVSLGFWIETLTVEGEIAFRCVANNSAGSAAKNLTLMVNVAPSIMEHSGVLEVKEGDDVSLYCNASGIPEPNITWTNLVSSESTSNKTLFIQNINRSQAGAYKCEATNECGTDSLTSTITVLYQPENVQLMTNVTASLKTCQDVLVNFTCTADGNPTPGYTLYKDNAMVADAQATPGVWILAMSSSGDFQYRCKANNTEGTDESENVTITVYVGPTFNAPLLNQDVVEGDNVSLTCNVLGIPSPSVRWTTPGNEGKDENPLFIPSIQRNQAGEYRCHASNECGNITDTLNIDVLYASFIPELTNVTLTKGENVTLFCNASGNPEPTVRWTKIDSGETRDEKTWYIEDVNGTDAGEYKCEAFNSVGNASDTLFVIVQYVPENTLLTSNLTGNTVCSGRVVNFTCQAEAHPPVVTYQLIKNGTDTVMLQSESGVFLTTVMGEGNYTYHCVSNNSAGTDASSPSLIIVNSSPSVDALPDSQEWIVGENKTLTCTVSGKPEPFVSWKKKDGDTRNESIWKFSAVAEAHGGEYTCEASNECGTVQRMVTVTVYVNRCKQECSPRKSCRLFGNIYACLCPERKKGENCDDNEELREVITTDFKILNEDFNDVYKNFDAPTTKEFIERIKKAFFDLFPNLFKCVVRALRPGSVDVDVELTFNSSVGMTEVETVLDKANSTGQFGAFKISNIGTAGSPPEETEKPEVPTKCSSFYEGENCNKVKPGWLALVIIAGVVVLAFIIAVIAFCMQKKKHNARSISIETAGDRNAENGFRNGSKARTGSGPYARENIAYEGEKFHTNGTSPEPAQPMVTFSPPRPEETPGISINDPGATKKAQPGEGTYADLGDFREKPQAPAPGPILRPPAYEETPYAEITGFLKKTENTEEDTENEEQAKTEDTTPTSSNNNEEANEDNEMVAEDEIQPMIDERVTNL